MANRTFLNAVLALIPDNSVRAEFGDDLAAGPAGRTRNIMIIDHSHSANLHIASSQFGNGGKDRRAFGAVGQAVGGVFDVASGKDLAIFQQNGCAHFEIGVGGPRLAEFERRFAGLCGPGEAVVLWLSREVCPLRSLKLYRKDVKDATQQKNVPVSRRPTPMSS